MDSDLNVIRLLKTGIGYSFAVIVCCFASGCQSETAKWEFARGMVAEESGDPATAINLMQAAVAKVPNDVTMKLKLARILAERGDRESLALCDEVLAEHPPLKSVYSRAVGRMPRLGDSPLGSKVICQQRLGEFVPALATYKLILADHVQRDRSELNNLTYFRALANRELMLAANDIETAIDQEEENRFPAGLYLPLRVKAAMAIGLTSRRLDRQREALELLTEMIEGLETDYTNFQAVISLTVFSQIQSAFPLSQDTEQEMELIRINQDLIRGCLVSLLTVRALIYQDLDRQQSANSDRIRVRELGFDADRLAEQLPNKFACLDSLANSTVYLDTRGYVLGLMPWDNAAIKELKLGGDSPARISSYRESLADLDMAVSAAETIRLALEGSLYNVPELSVQDVKQMDRDIRHTEAVLLYHRVQVHERAGKSRRAERDRQAIQSLGFSPDENLF
jgi:hypothetical protein